MMFEGKVVLVTGAGGGIGRATAQLFAAKGARVVVNDLGGSTVGEGSSSAPAEETVRLIRDAGGEAIVSADSVSEWSSAQKIVQAALDQFGRIDVVVNNAGNIRWAPFWEMPPEDYHAVVDTHVGGSFYVSRAAAPHFKAQGSGVFVHTTSTSGLMGHFKQVPYCTAKAAIVGLSKAIAIEMKAFGVRSNCMAPFAQTRMVAGQVRSPEHQAVLDKLTPEQPASLTVALASDAAADITGQVFIMRGNEIFVAGQGFPVKGIHRAGGWAPEDITTHAMPALAPGFTPPIGFVDYFSWDII
jgi:NAD(P)-dependent dehydrogenase (short-subunit alcohol dehydrogenase family)